MMALQSQVIRTDSKGNIWGLQQKITVEEAIASEPSMAHTPPTKGI
jgi:hypothetical protein